MVIEMAEHKISLEQLKQAGIEPKIGTELSMKLKDGTTIALKITKVEKDTVIATSK